MDKGSRIKAKRIEKGYTLLEVANKLGIREATMQRYESGTIKNIKYDTMSKLAKILDTTPAYLSGWEEEKNKNTKGIQVPVLGKIQAGIPLEAIEDIIDYEEIPIKMSKQGEYFGMKINDDSMAPRFKKGDVVIVRKQSNIANDDIAIILVNGNDATIKKIKKDKNGIALIPLNPNYQIRYYSNAEIVDLPVKCIGKVVELRGRF